MSVIVPVYRVDELLLRACLESLGGQSSSDLEFIIVDDASPDSCGDICREYEKKDNRFKVISLEKNRGLSGARNAGLEHVKGDYVVFVDGDDRVPIGFFEKLERYVKANPDDDIVCFAYIRNPEDEAYCHGMERHEFPNALSLAESIISHEEFKKEFPHALLPAAHVKAFKRSFLIDNKLLFWEGLKKGEDRVFMVAALAYEPKMSYFDCVGYVYIVNPSSICHKYNRNMPKDCDMACSIMEESIKQHYQIQGAERLLQALPYMQLIFSRDAEEVTFFHCEGNPDFLHERNEYKAYWKWRRNAVVSCSLSRIKGKRNKPILALKKAHLYSLAYYLECVYAKVRSH